MTSRFRYLILAIFLFILFSLFFIKSVIPIASIAGSRFVETVNEMKVLHQVNEKNVPTDSLLDQYRFILKQMDSFLLVDKTASGVLKHLLDLSQKHGLALLDLSTQEPASSSQGIEYPVVFQAVGAFPKVHRFLTDVENSDVCVKVSTIRMERDDSGNAKAYIELSVFVREPLP